MTNNSRAITRRGEELMVGDTVQVHNYIHSPRRKSIGVVERVLPGPFSTYPVFVHFAIGGGTYFSAKELKLLTSRDEDLYY